MACEGRGPPGELSGNDGRALGAGPRRGRSTGRDGNRSTAARVGGARGQVIAGVGWVGGRGRNRPLDSCRSPIRQCPSCSGSYHAGVDAKVRPPALPPDSTHRPPLCAPASIECFLGREDAGILLPSHLSLGSWTPTHPPPSKECLSRCPQLVRSPSARIGTIAGFGIKSFREAGGQEPNLPRGRIRYLYSMSQPPGTWLTPCHDGEQPHRYGLRLKGALRNI